MCSNNQIGYLMPQVNLMSIEMPTALDTKASTGESATSSSGKDGVFSQMVDQHLSNETSGKKALSAARTDGNNSHKEVKDATKSNGEAKLDANNDSTTESTNDSDNESVELVSEKAKAAEEKKLVESEGNEIKPVAEQETQVKNKVEKALASSNDFLALLDNSEKLLKGDSEKAVDSESAEKLALVASQLKPQAETSANKITEGEGKTNSEGQESKNTIDLSITKANNQTTENLDKKPIALDPLLATANKQNVTAENKVSAKEAEVERQAAPLQGVKEAAQAKDLSSSNNENSAKVATQLNGNTSKVNIEAEKGSAGLATEDIESSEAQELTNSAKQSQQSVNTDAKSSTQVNPFGDDKNRNVTGDSSKLRQPIIDNGILPVDKDKLSSADERIGIVPVNPLASKIGQPASEVQTKLTDVINQATQDVIKMADTNKNSDSSEYKQGEQSLEFIKQQLEQETLKAGAEKVSFDKFIDANIKTPPLNPLSAAMGVTTTQTTGLADTRVSAEYQATLEAITQSASIEKAQDQKSSIAIQQETISIYRKDFASAVKDKVMLMVNQKLQQFDIQLDPPELGNVHVRVNLQSEQAVVSFVVQNQQAKEAFEQNTDKLKEMLSQSGVDLGETNVSQQDRQAQNSDGEGQQSGTFGQRSQQSSDEQHSVIDGKLIKASANGIDYYA